ncbi:glutathione S-transferase C-terminal domain-containing protein [Kitasatospora sp. NPDC049285]|uniref:glutathione S-transferase C-terminal domain-containing protein n=1 Tax=Kitasatospora sp. NPDC049285 TaxID=3157096 RepID=UPI0034468E4B
MPVPFPSAVPAFRSRIGRDADSGYPAVPHRYRLHLVRTDPPCRWLAVTHALLGLDEILPTDILPDLPDAPDGGYRALRPLYEAGAHRHPGPARPPALSDGWTGRIVSTDPYAIACDLARRFDRTGADLLPAGTETAVAAIDRLSARGIESAAGQAATAADPAVRAAALRTLLHSLDTVERRLAEGRGLLDGPLTLADVRLWAALHQLDTVHLRGLGSAAAQQVADHPRTWGYTRGLAAHPAFARHVDPPAALPDPAPHRTADADVPVRLAG